MSWQKEVGSGTNRATSYRDLCNKIVAMMTSQHAATVAINNGGTGGTYVIGDIITLTHAGAVLDARFEVLTVSAGQILTLQVSDSGAFSNRLASAAISAGGSGYVVGDVLELSTGTQRENAKVQVATLSGSAVATVTVFENGGAYTVAPSSPGASVGVGPAAYAGDDAATFTPTMTGMIGTTALAVTGGGGTGATVDITLAETGWTVDGRNTNDRTENSLTDEKEIVLVGDASGITNKPYIGMLTATFTSGINTRYAIVLFGMLAHNSGIALKNQPGLSPGVNSGTDALEDGGSYLLCDEDDAQDMDFWLSVDDQRILGVININPAAASTDDGEYTNFHVGLMNKYATETENPYPFFVYGPGRTINADPSASSVNISCMPECMSFTGTTSSSYFYVAETTVWEYLKNSSNLSADTEFTRVMYPLGKLASISGSSDANKITIEGVIETSNDWSATDRGSAAIKLYPVPGTSDLPFLWPCNILYRPGNTVINEALDTPRGEIRGLFWLTGTDETGTKRVDFSEDTVTIGGDRYRVFHNHVHTNTYSYYAIKEDI